MCVFMFVVEIEVGEINYGLHRFIITAMISNTLVGIMCLLVGNDGRTSLVLMS